MHIEKCSLSSDRRIFSIEHYVLAKLFYWRGAESESIEKQYVDNIVKKKNHQSPKAIMMCQISIERTKITWKSNDIQVQVEKLDSRGRLLWNFKYEKNEWSKLKDFTFVIAFWAFIFYFCANVYRVHTESSMCLCSTRFQFEWKSKAFFANTKSDDISAGYLIFNIIENYRLRCIISNWICLYVAVLSIPSIESINLCMWLCVRVLAC